MGGSKSAKRGPNPLADMDRGGPNPLADLDRGVQIRGGSKSAVTPAQIYENKLVFHCSLLTFKLIYLVGTKIHDW